MSTLTLRLGDCLVRMGEIVDNSIVASVSDPPYDLTSAGKRDASKVQTTKGFMGRAWDGTGVAFDPPLWDNLFRVLAPGGVVKAFSGTRTYHRMAVAMERAGFKDLRFEAWTYGCLSEDTEILTQAGWVHYRKAAIGTSVMGFDIGTGQFDWQPVEETFDYPYDREAFHLTGVGTDHIVSVKHRCVVQREGQWVFVLSDDLEASEVVPGVCWDVQGIPRLEVINVHVDRIQYSGDVWCVRVPTGAFLARRNGLVFITGNSGFPKSLSVSKAIDKSLGAVRESKRIEFSGNALMRHGGDNTRPWMEEALERGYHELQGDEPASDLAKLWDGWGTALKPAWEIVLVANKPKGPE